MRALSLSSLFLILLAACAATPGPSAVPGPAPDDSLDAVVWIQHAEEYGLSTRTVYRAAGRLLDEALADPEWDAIDPAERSAAAAGLPPAIIFDIDETILDNSAYQARLVLSGDEYATDTWADWVDEARAIPVPGALEFTRAAAERGIALVLISNREHAQEAATLDNLRRQGFPVDAADVEYLGLGMPVQGCEDAGQNKVCRRQSVAERYRVLMQFGDQLSDFTSIGDNRPQARRQATDVQPDWVGERWFMLPNPGYGYWESALFDDDWSLPRGERRSIKREALRTR